MTPAAAVQRDLFFKQATATNFSEPFELPSEDDIPDDAMSVTISNKDYLYSNDHQYNITHIRLRSLGNLPHFNLVADRTHYKVYAAFVAKEGCDFTTGLNELLKPSSTRRVEGKMYSTNDVGIVLEWIDNLDNTHRLPTGSIQGLNEAVNRIWQILYTT